MNGVAVRALIFCLAVRTELPVHQLAITLVTTETLFYLGKCNGSLASFAFDQCLTMLFASAVAGVTISVVVVGTGFDALHRFVAIHAFQIHGLSLRALQSQGIRLQLGVIILGSESLDSEV